MIIINLCINTCSQFRDELCTRQAPQGSSCHGVGYWDCSDILIFIVNSFCYSSSRSHDIKWNGDDCKSLEMRASCVEGWLFWDWDAAGHWAWYSDLKAAGSVIFHIEVLVLHL